MVIFFDLDETLLDHAAAAKAGATRFFETFRSYFPEDLDAFLSRWDIVGEKYFQTGEAGKKLDKWGSRRARIRELFSEELTDEEAGNRFRIYLETYEKYWKLFPDSLPCLKSLRPYSLGLITNGDGDQQRSKTARLGLGPYLSHIVISHEVGCAKPDRAIFELAARKAGVNIGDCIYVGDRLNTDARAGQEAGMKGVWLDRKDIWKGQETGVPVIRGLKELPALLEKEIV